MNSDHVLDVLLQGLRNDALGEPTFELAQRRAVAAQRAINFVHRRMSALTPPLTQRLQPLVGTSQSLLEAQMFLHKGWGFVCEALMKVREAQNLAFNAGSPNAATFSLWESNNAMLALGFALREMAQMKDPMVANREYFSSMPSAAEVCTAFQDAQGPSQTVLLIRTTYEKVLFARQDDGTLLLPAWSDLPRRRFSLVDGDGSIEYDAAPFWCGPNEEAWAYRGLFRPARRPMGYDSNHPGSLFTHAWVGAEGAPRPVHAQAPLVWDDPATIPEALLDANTLHVLKESEL